MEHKIKTPIRQLPRRIPPHQREIIDEQLKESVANGRVEEEEVGLFW